METFQQIMIIVIRIAITLAILHVLMDNRQPAKTMAWALLIFFFPIIGIVFYLFFGINTRRERLISERSLNQLTKRSMLNFVEQEDFHVEEIHRPLVDLFINQSFALPFHCSIDEIFTDGRSFFDDLLTAVRRAKSHIHINLYIFSDDELGEAVADALIAKAKQGVEVRIIYDDVGCWKVKESFFERMRQHGIEAYAFLPVRFPSFTRKVNYRNHRKLIIIDGRVGYIGGMNIAGRYVDGINGMTWRDTMTRISGPAVYGLQRAFLVDWYFVDRTLISDRKYYPAHLQSADYSLRCPEVAQIVTSGPLTPYPELMQGYVRLILAARHYIYIETPYFMPTETVLFALKTAAQGGVDVRIIVPKKGDSHFVEWASRSYLREVAEAGVQVYLYTPGFLHSKMLVCDDTISSCGSTNIDFRSFENNFEANAFIYGEDTATRFRRIFLADQDMAEDFTDSSIYHNHTFLHKLWESVTRLMAPLF